jgi:magnesium chelatase accessory protein
MGDDLEWERDLTGWPHHEASRLVEAASMRWHVQWMGQGPGLLLVHGTGASTHSWRALMPIFARHFTVVAVDLPGHAFSSTPRNALFTLHGMGSALGTLLRALDVTPTLAVGHSAGAALLINMALEESIAPRGIVSLNGALAQFKGLARHVFSPLARLLVLNPVVPRMFTWGAGGRRSVERLIRDTGSALDREGVDLYARLMRSPRHVAGALAMMANWDLEPLERDLPKLAIPLLLVAAGGDLAVPADVSFGVRDRVPGAVAEYVRGLGHLAHEERPAEIAALIIEWARKIGTLQD